MYSLVITAFDEPVGIGVDAVQGPVGERDVPFIAIPCGGGPPIARGSPGSGGVENLSMNARGRDADRTVVYK